MNSRKILASSASSGLYYCFILPKIEMFRQNFGKLAIERKQGIGLKMKTERAKYKLRGLEL